MASIKEESVKGVVWNGIGRFANLGISFILSIILARLLTPEDYGTVGIYGVFFAIAATFIDSGFSSALIQKKNLSDTDTSTAFYFNIVVGIFFYIAFFISSPLISRFFDVPILSDIIKVTSINLVIGSLTTVQTALYQKRVDFKTTSLASLVANVLSGLLGIYLAYTGYGVWALVYQGVAMSSINSLILWVFSKWHPIFAFSWKSFRDLFSFGGKIFLSSLLSTIYSQGANFALGKFYTSKDLGLYTKGSQLASLFSTNVSTVLQTVTFPVLAKIQDEDERLIQVYRVYIKFTSLIIFFLMMLMLALAKPFILFLYTSKWEGAIIYLQLFCLGAMFGHIDKINLNLFYVKGRGDVVLKLEIVKKIFAFAILIASIPMGVLAICASKIVYEQIALFINMYPTGKYFNYGCGKQWKDFGKYLLLSFIANVPAFLLSFTSIPYILVLIAGTLVSVLIYVCLLKLSNDDIFNNYVVTEIRSRIKQFHKR